MGKKSKSIKLLGIMILVSLGTVEAVRAQLSVIAGPVTYTANGHDYYLPERSTRMEAEDGDTVMVTDRTYKGAGNMRDNEDEI